MCQRPKRAFLISTEVVDEAIEKSKNGCQRPKRAFLISTVEDVLTELYSGDVSTP